MTKEINSLVLAYLGDTIYEDYIREYLINKGIRNVNALQQEAISFVSAKAQASYLQELLNKDFFNDIELEIIKRARNHKTNSHPKNCDIITYKYATALEALIGYLKLEKKDDRIKQIMKEIVKVNLC